jgi:hypothetical protein
MSAPKGARVPKQVRSTSERARTRSRRGRKPGVLVIVFDGSRDQLRTVRDSPPTRVVGGSA